MRVTAALLILCMTAACNPSPEPTGPALGELSLDVDATRTAEGIRITNSTDREIAYAVWNQGWLALFAPCAGGPDCPRLAPGASLTVDTEEIDGWAPGATHAIVRWWHIVPDGSGGVKAGEVHEIVIAL